MPSSHCRGFQGIACRICGEQSGPGTYLFESWNIDAPYAHCLLAAAILLMFKSYLIHKKTFWKSFQ